MSLIGENTANQLIKSGHKGGIDTGIVDPLAIEEYSTQVLHSLYEDGFMMNFFNMESLSGTDTYSKPRIGQTSLQAVIPGVRPTDSAPTFDDVKVKVDRQILARAVQAQIDDFRDKLNVRKHIGMEHGYVISDFVNETFIGQLIKGAQLSYKDPAGNITGGWNGAAVAGTYEVKVRTAPEGHKGATALMLDAAGDENDGNAFEDKITDLVVAMKKKNVNVKKGYLLIRPEQEKVLLQNDKLVSRDFTGVGSDYATYDLKMVGGLKVIVTNFFPENENVGEQHLLSHAMNDNAYNITQADANCVAVYMQPASLLAAQLQSVESDVFYNKTEKQWFIDSALSFGVTPDQLEVCGGIFKFAS